MTEGSGSPETVCSPSGMAGRVPDDFRRIRSPFEGALVRLRAIEDEDVAAINREFWNPAVTRHVAVAWPEPVAGTEEFVRRVRANEDTVAFAIETLAGELVGVCSLEGIDPAVRSAGLGIWIAEG